jgi:phosphoribosyl 1,2-cyclic phosphodiesterase
MAVTPTITELTATSTVANANYLQPNGYKVVIDRQRFKNIEFFAQTVQHPTISIPAVDVPFRRTIVAEPGNTATFSELNIDVIIDEEMKVYEEIYNWMTSMLSYNVQPELANNRTPDFKLSYDMTLSILTSQNNANRRIRYKDAFPTSLGGIQFTSSTGDIQYIVMPVSFSFSTFELI